VFVRGASRFGRDGYGVPVAPEPSSQVAVDAGDPERSDRAADVPMSGGASAVRYRCGACGNLTRFDVVVNRRTRSFHHYSLAGELSVENVDVLAESVEEVSCRWCGHGKDIEVVDD
jgi:hypothetical protein